MLGEGAANLVDSEASNDSVIPPDVSGVDVRQLSEDLGQAGPEVRRVSWLEEEETLVVLGIETAPSFHVRDLNREYILEVK